MYSVRLEILALLGASGLVFNIDYREVLEMSEAHVFLFIKIAEDIKLCIATTLSTCVHGK